MRWYHRKNRRKGVLWESRYTSILVEEEERALRTMVASIDLNPVRAGMVSDPADYRWSGYVEAIAGKARAGRGLVRIIGRAAWPKMRMEDWRRAGGRRAGGRRAQGWRGGETLEDQEGTKASAPGGGAGRDTRGRVCSPWGDEPFPAQVERRGLVF